VIKEHTKETPGTATKMPAPLAQKSQLVSKNGRGHPEIYPPKVKIDPITLFSQPRLTSDSSGCDSVFLNINFKFRARIVDITRNHILYKECDGSGEVKKVSINDVNHVIYKTGIKKVFNPYRKKIETTGTQRTGKGSEGLLSLIFGLLSLAGWLLQMISPVYVIIAILSAILALILGITKIARRKIYGESEWFMAGCMGIFLTILVFALLLAI